MGWFVFFGLVGVFALLEIYYPLPADPIYRVD